jgi:NAD+--asparagine ADP-ribosyltransferase
MENQTELNEIESEKIAEQQPLPWENAPEDIYYYSHINDDGVIFDITESAEFAYSSGYFDNQISKDDVEVSDVNNWHYLKSKCPMKTEEDKLKDQYKLEITQLKKQLSDTDYKAIKYAEGQISESEYASVKELRQRYRDRINELEAML